MLSLLRFSQLLIVLFVGSVTLWYCVTPYLIAPHPKVLEDVMAKAEPNPDTSAMAKNLAGKILVENWTKWRLFVNSSLAKDPQVIFGNTVSAVDLPSDKAVMNMEWRSDYKLNLLKNPSSGKLGSVEKDAPWSADYGIYNHFTFVHKGEEDNVKVLPRFLFGLPFETLERMYGSDMSGYPVMGVFTTETRYDRIIIQLYMNVVTLSLIFLMYANNPPDTVKVKKVE